MGQSDKTFARKCRLKNVLSFLIGAFKIKIFYFTKFNINSTVKKLC